MNRYSTQFLPSEQLFSRNVQILAHWTRTWRGRDTEALRLVIIRALQFWHIQYWWILIWIWIMWWIIHKSKCFLNHFRGYFNHAFLQSTSELLRLFIEGWGWIVSHCLWRPGDRNRVQTYQAEAVRVLPWDPSFSRNWLHSRLYFKVSFWSCSRFLVVASQKVTWRSLTYLSEIWEPFQTSDHKTFHIFPKQNIFLNSSRNLNSFCFHIYQGDRERTWVSNLLIGCRKKRSGK